MRQTSHRRSRRHVISFIVAVALLRPVGGLTAQANAKAQPALQVRFEEFIAGFDTLSTEGFASFFPTAGQFAYKHTIYTDSTTLMTEWRFPASETRAALRGALWAAFTVQWEGQPIGLLAHQVLERKGRWRRVGKTRFVPPGADSSSATYVEWRLEGARWVISEFGDEYYPPSVRPPCWWVECRG